jgi:hypothetical protein
MTERFTFPFNEAGLVTCLELTLSHRRAGFRTQVVERQMTKMTRVYSLLATPPERPNRAARGYTLERIV